MTIEIPASERYRLDLDDKNGTVKRRTRLLVIALNAWLEDEAERLARVPGVDAIDEGLFVLVQALADRDAHYKTRPKAD